MKWFDEIVAALSEHYEPKPLVIAERFHFHKRNQAASETVVEFIAELRWLARHCEFKTFLEEALWDRFVCGLNKKAIQNKLLTEKDLTLAKALQIATGMEAAAKEVMELQAMSNAAALTAGATVTSKGDVHKVTTNPCYCYRCGKPENKSAQCPAKGLRCWNCGKVGHVRKVCKQARKPVRRAPGKPRGTPKVKTVLEDDQGSEEGAYHLNHITAKPGPAIQVDLCLNGKPVTMKLDTGAPVSLMCWRMFDRLFPESTLQPCNLPMKTYLGRPLL